jgi:ABC-type sugar transport system ATPase subunit
VLDNVSFEVRRGELLALAGLVGAGRSEVARAIFGIDPVDGGRIEIDGRPVGIGNPTEAIKHRIALLPEDRKQQGLVLVLSVADNVAVAAPDRLGGVGGLVPPALRMRVARRFVESLRIKTPSVRQPVRLLSGGNQQKVVLAKWLLTEADIFIFDEPTRGIDVGAKVEVYRLMNDLLARGAAIVMISSELPEVLGMSDRILVMREGRIVAELDGASATQEEIMTHAAAGTHEEAVA